MNIIGFAICVENEDYSASLEKHKVYAVTVPESNDPRDYVRVIDESGEDYLYPADWFESVSLGTRIEASLMEALSL